MSEFEAEPSPPSLDDLRRLIQTTLRTGRGHPDIVRVVIISLVEEFNRRSPDRRLERIVRQCIRKLKGRFHGPD